MFQQFINKYGAGTNGIQHTTDKPYRHGTWKKRLKRCLPPSSPNFVDFYVLSQVKISCKWSDDIPDSVTACRDCTPVWTLLPYLGKWASLGSEKQQNVCMNGISFIHFNIKLRTTVLQLTFSVFCSLVTITIYIFQRAQCQNKAVYKDYLQSSWHTLHSCAS
jgi:hypothetical protein